MPGGILLLCRTKIGNDEIHPRSIEINLIHFNEFGQQHKHLTSFFDVNNNRFIDLSLFLNPYKEYTQNDAKSGQKPCGCCA